MELDVDERRTLHAALASAFNNPAAFDELALLGVGINPGDIKPTEGVSDRILALIAEVEARNQVVQLIKGALSLPSQGTNVALRLLLEPIQKHLENRQAPSGLFTDPFKTCLVDDTTPFIDRITYREKLEDLFKKRKRYLVVNGPLGSGKSHSQLLILEIAKKKGHKMSYIDLTNEIPAKYYPNDLARQIASDLTLPGTDKMPEPQEMGEQYVRELFDWLVEKMKLDESRITWIVLDGFDNEDLHPNTRDFLFKLIQAIHARRLQEVRLVLLDYPTLLQRLPPNVKSNVHTEELQYFGSEEVKKYFELFFEQANIDAEANQAESLTQEIFQELPGDLKDEERLIAIMEGVMERALGLLPES